MPTGHRPRPPGKAPHRAEIGSEKTASLCAVAPSHLVGGAHLPGPTSRRGCSRPRSRAPGPGASYRPNPPRKRVHRPAGEGDVLPPEIAADPRMVRHRRSRAAAGVLEHRPAVADLGAPLGRPVRAEPDVELVRLPLADALDRRPGEDEAIRRHVGGIPVVRVHVDYPRAPGIVRRTAGRSVAHALTSANPPTPRCGRDRRTRRAGVARVPAEHAGCPHRKPAGLGAVGLCRGSAVAERMLTPKARR